MQKFCEMIEEEARKISDIYRNVVPPEMAKEDNEKFQAAQDCFICNKKFNKDKTILF